LLDNSAVSDYSGCMNKNNLANIRRTLTEVAKSSTKLKQYVGEIADGPRRHLAEQVWYQLDMGITAAREQLKKWRIGYPKGKHRIKEDQLAAIRQWIAAAHPKPKVRKLATTLELSPTTVYKVLKELGWKKNGK
jgi:hypothetical protein